MYITECVPDEWPCLINYVTNKKLFVNCSDFLTQWSNLFNSIKILWLTKKMTLNYYVKYS